MKRSKQATPWVHGVLGACLLAGAAAAPALAQQHPTGPPAAVATRALGIDTTSFDRGVRPQDDFFRFVNGGWLKRTEIPADKSSYGTFTELADQSEAALHSIIEEAAASRAHKAGTDLQKVGDLYRSFMDTAAHRARRDPAAGALAREGARSQEPLRAARRTSLPCRSPGSRRPSASAWARTARTPRATSSTLSQGGLGLPDRDYYLKNDAKFAEMRAAYQKYIETLLSLAGEKNAAGCGQGRRRLRDGARREALGPRARAATAS